MAAESMSNVFELYDQLLDVVSSEYWQTHRRVPTVDTEVSTRWDGKASAVIVSCGTVIGYLPPAHDAIVSTQCCRGAVTWSRAGGDPVIMVRLTVGA